MDADPWRGLCTRGTELFNEYTRTGNMACISNAVNNFQEALALCPRDDPYRATILQWLPFIFSELYKREGNLDDITQAIAYYRQALDLSPPGHPSRLMSLTNLTLGLQTRYQREGDVKDLVSMIELYQQTLDLRPSGDPDRSYALNNLADALRTRYVRERELNDLLQAIYLHQQALDLRPPGHLDRSESLHSLATLLLERYRREGEANDLARSIDFHQQALDLHPPGHPNRSYSLSGLAVALDARYQREGDENDMTSVIELHQEALDLRPPGHTNRSDSLSSLATALDARYRRKGHANDLFREIQLHQQALDLNPPGHPNHSYSLNNLADALETKYLREGDVNDLIHAIELHRQALDSRPTGHPNRSESLSNLANALRTRYLLEGDDNDLVHTIELHQQAVDLRPPGHPYRSDSLNNLAVALETRYRREGDVNDLIRNIELHGQALELHPPGHPSRSYSLSNLAIALDARYLREGDVKDLIQAIDLHQEALDLRPPGHLHRFDSLSSLANALRTRYRRDGDVNDLLYAIELHQQAFDLCPPGHPNRSQSLGNLAVVINERYRREGDPKDLVREIELHQEALDLRPRGHPFRSISLTRVANVLLTHYKLLRDADQHLAYAKGIPADALPSCPSIAQITAFLREASRSETCSPMHCLMAALDWIGISRDIDPDSTLEAYTTALHQLDVVLALGKSLEQRHDSLSSDNVSVMTKGLGVEAATWALQRGEPERAIELLEQGRSLLLGQIGRYRVELGDIRRIDSDLANHFADLSQRLDAAVVADQRTEEDGSGNNDPYGRYRKISTEWNRTVNKIRALPGFDTFLRPVPYDQLRKVAADGPIIVIVPSESASDALILTEHSPIHHIHLPRASSSRLEELSRNFTEILDPINNEGSRTEWACLSNLTSLWNEVVGPIAQALQNDLSIPLHSRVWWCPASVTSFLPLHAAGLYGKGQSEANFANLFTSSYTPTLHALLRARRHATTSAPRKLLVVCQPETPNEAPLDRAMEEAEAIAEVIPQDFEVTSLVGKEGTCDAVRHGMGVHPWIHFICHGVQAEGQPLNSYLSLHDGHLTLHKIIETYLPNANFAFLAACHSAAGDQDLANEALHLAAGMLFAGFRGVVGTLWTMADEDGPPLAEVFYGEMLQHGDSRGAALALSNAIRQLRRNKVPVNRWMRFIHIGI